MAGNGRQNEPQSRVLGLLRTSPAAPPRVFIQSQKGNSAKFGHKRAGVFFGGVPAPDLYRSARGALMYLAADYIHPTPHNGRCRVRIYRPDLPEEGSAARD